MSNAFKGGLYTGLTGPDGEEISIQSDPLSERYKIEALIDGGDTTIEFWVTAKDIKEFVNSLNALLPQ